jgi:hypothetical protein
MKIIEDTKIGVFLKFNLVNTELRKTVLFRSDKSDLNKWSIFYKCIMIQNLVVTLINFSLPSLEHEYRTWMTDASYFKKLLYKLQWDSSSTEVN